MLLSPTPHLSKELCQFARLSLDISGREDPGDHGNAIGASIDDLSRVVNGDAADGKYRHVDVLLHLPKNPQGDIGPFGLSRGGKWRAERHIVSPLLLRRHSACHVAVA